MKKLLYIVNVDWYFNLHWLDRAMAAKNNGYDVHIALSVTDPCILEKLTSRGFVVYPINIIRKNLGLVPELRAIIEIYQLIKQINPDLVNSITIKPNIYSCFIAALLGKKNISSIPGLGLLKVKHPGFINDIPRRCLLGFYRWMIRNLSDYSTFENQEDYRYFLANDLLHKGQVIPGSGVNASLFVPQKKENATFSILFAGRLLYSKGLELLVQATEQINASGMAVELHVAGLPDKDVRQAIPLSIIDAWHKSGLITWLGSRDDMHRLIPQYNVVCLPSLYGEGIPRILIEANACGVPVIASNIAGCNEFIKDGYNGFLCDHRVDDLAAKIIQLYCNNALAKVMGENGRKQVSQYYSMAIVQEKTLEIYSKILSG